MWRWNLHIEKESFIKRKPRVKRPNLKYKGYDSIWEYLLHETILKDWKHHVDKVDYVIEHSYEPDFVRVLKKKKILLESKGRFWDHAEYSKCQGQRKEKMVQREHTLSGQRRMGLDGLVKKHCQTIG